MKNWSLKTKMMVVSMVVMVVVTGASALFFSQLISAKNKTEASYKVSNLLANVGKNFDEMTIGMRGYLLNPSRNSEWENKLKADENAISNLGIAKEASFNPELTSMIEQIGTFDKETMDRLENEFGAIVKKGNREEAEGFYFNQYLPSRQKMEGYLTSATEIANRDMNQFQAHQVRIIYYGGGLLFGITFLSLVIAFFFNQRMAHKVTHSIESVADQLNNSVLSIEIASKNTAATSQQIATSATENASAITETLSISEAGKKEAERGRSVVGKMSEAMNEVYEANGRLEQLIKVIEDIQGKTKVINDIVFETRLLSFNASIEAARAGSHGKGFAVVAEEVGKLASVSGKAAEEINTLLASSTHQVKEMVSTISQRVTIARDTTTQCEQVFTQMNHSMSEINSAMMEMEKETHENSASSEEMATQAQTLALESKSLSGLLRKLKGLISGDAHQQPHSPHAFERVDNASVHTLRESELTHSHAINPSLNTESSTHENEEFDRSDVRWKAS